MIRPEQTRPWRRRRLRRSDPDPDAPVERPDPPIYHHCTRAIRFGGLVAVGKVTLHSACAKGWRGRSAPPLF